MLQDDLVIQVSHVTATINKNDACPDSQSRKLLPKKLGETNDSEAAKCLASLQESR